MLQTVNGPRDVGYTVSSLFIPLLTGCYIKLLVLLSTFLLYSPGHRCLSSFLKWHYYVYYILYYSETRCIFVLCQRRSVPRIGTEIIQPLFERTRSITGVTARLSLWCPRQPFIPLIVRVNGCNILH